MKIAVFDGDKRCWYKFNFHNFVTNYYPNFITRGDFENTLNYQIEMQNNQGKIIFDNFDSSFPLSFSLIRFRVISKKSFTFEVLFYYNILVLVTFKCSEKIFFLRFKTIL